MFRVKIDFGAVLHAEKTPEKDGVDAKADTGAEECFVDRWGDWAEEMARPVHPQLTKEDLCRTFRDKFRDGGEKDSKSVA